MNRRGFFSAMPALPLLPMGGGPHHLLGRYGPASEPYGAHHSRDGVITPAAYGAKGDGASDDTTALQAALNAAKAFLQSFGLEQARVVIDLHGREHIISAALSWPASQGITLCNGTIKADTAFPPNRYLIEFEDTGVAQLTRLSTLRDIILDGQRRNGTGCLYLVNHSRTTIENCFLKRMKSYGIRSVNGTGLSNELIVRGVRFDEWPAGDGIPSSVDSTAISIEHHDSLVSECVIGPARVGIRVTGQFNEVVGNHVYVGYRPESPESGWVPKSDGLLIEGAHTLVAHNYVDNCCIRGVGGDNTQVLDNLFLVSTGDPTYAFINLNPPAGTYGLQGVLIRHNKFLQTGAATVAALNNAGPGTWSGTEHSVMRDNVFTPPAKVRPLVPGILMPGLVDNLVTATLPALPPGQTDNYDPGPYETVRLTAHATGSVISGFANGWAGRMLRVVNVGSGTLVLLHQAGSAPGNRVKSPTSAGIGITPDGVVELYYDEATSRWLITNAQGFNAPAILTDAPIIAIDAKARDAFQVTLGADRTMGQPVNPVPGQEIVITVFQDGNGGRTLAWNSVFKHAWSNAGNSAGKRSTIRFRYDGASWVQCAVQSPFV